jgi:hypothetical protein
MGYKIISHCEVQAKDPTITVGHIRKAQLGGEECVVGTPTRGHVGGPATHDSTKPPPIHLQGSIVTRVTGAPHP